jgi:hypothetical protein
MSPSPPEPGFWTQASAEIDRYPSTTALLCERWIVADDEKRKEGLS